MSIGTNKILIVTSRRSTGFELTSGPAGVADCFNDGTVSCNEVREAHEAEADNYLD